MLDLAEALNPLLDERHERLENGEEDDEDIAETTLQLVFFDGEEAYKDWTATDSIYGARYVVLPFSLDTHADLRRHLAQKWSTSYIQPNMKRRLLPSAETEIGTIEHLILLDLLGAPQPQIHSTFVDTAWLFDAVASVEKRLAESGVFAYEKDGVKADKKFSPFFIPRNAPQYAFGIEDDHIPFLRLGVSVLHIIASPFPKVWHTIGASAATHLHAMSIHIKYRTMRMPWTSRLCEDGISFYAFSWRNISTYDPRSLHAPMTARVCGPWRSW